jgi:hypothetical protein
MATKPNPERLPTEANPKSTTPKEPLLLLDMGKASDKTKGGGGVRSETGIPPYNFHF